MRCCVMLALVLASCNSDDEETCVIEGTYSVTDRIDQSDPGDCPSDDSDEADTVQVVDRGDGTVEVSSAGLGGACSGEVNGCSVSLQCDGFDADGNRIATFNSEWTFSSDGFEGYSTSHVEPGVIDAFLAGCTANSIDTGVRL